ncbi:A24 family peptidase [Streptantibioticus parmotrematis]|uniref:A24 family peptidase n=1 Tax=Streptantibioticus parmotrematis TaxID=2873249 RepID=UPI0033D1754F
MAPHVLVVCAAALWGLATGSAVPRAADRLAAPGADHESTAAGRAVRVRSALLGCLVCAALGQVVGVRPELAVWLLLAPVGLTLARVDLTAMRLPDALTLPAAAGTALALGGAALLPAHAGSWPRALLGGLALGVGYFGLMVVNPSGMAFGDVKLAPTLGMALAWYGWPVLLTGTVLCFGCGALVALGLLATRRAGRHTAIPFGPFMLAGTLGGVLLGAAAH